MTDRPILTIDLHLDLTDEELAELERALIKARATELGEVRRRNVRLTAGYGDDTTREVLVDEGRRAELRYAVLARSSQSKGTAPSSPFPARADQPCDRFPRDHPADRSGSGP